MIRGLDRGEDSPQICISPNEKEQRDLDLTIMATSTMVNNGSKFSIMIKSIEQAYLEVVFSLTIINAYNFKFLFGVS